MEPEDDACRSEARCCKTALARACEACPKIPLTPGQFYSASTFFRSTSTSTTFLEAPRRISKVCCTPQQNSPVRSAIGAALDSSKICHTCGKNCRTYCANSRLLFSPFYRVAKFASKLALDAAIARGLRFRRGRSASLSRLSSWRKRV